MPEGPRLLLVIADSRPYLFGLEVKPILKRVLGGIAGTVALAGFGAFGFVWVQARRFDASMDEVHQVELVPVSRSLDAGVVERGKHLVNSVAGCAARDCHGSDFAGGRPLRMGPVGTIIGPNVTAGGMLAVYSDEELGRIIRYGVKKDGRSVRMMTVQDFSWLPDSDVSAIVSYLRIVPKLDKENGATRVGILGKVLDRQGKFVWDVARFVAKLPPGRPRAPEPTENYGRYVVRLCMGCHGETLSGGPIPGAPPSIPTPSNITLHETGISGYSFDEFVQLLRTGLRKNGKQLDPFMTVERTRNLDDTELKALWAAIRAAPAKPFGGR